MSTGILSLAAGDIDRGDIAGRGTVEPVRTSPAPEEAAAPEPLSKMPVDTGPDLVGLYPTRVASDRREPMKTPPSHLNLTGGDYGVVDRSWATKGTAARREEMGEWGHGTFDYAIGITPEIHDNTKMGLRTFVTNASSGVQDRAGNYMSPSPESAWAQLAAAAYERRAADARALSQLPGFWSMGDA